MVFERIILEARYARTLLPLARIWRQAADRALSGTGVSAATGWALAQVGRNGDDVRQTDLAHELDLTGASLVRLLDLMSAGGLIERHRDTVDARVSRVRLTDAGRALVERIEAALADLRHEMLAAESDADLATAVAVAERLAARFQRRRGA